MHEVVGAFLERVEERNQEIHAYVTMLGDGNTTCANGEVVEPPISWCLTYLANFTRGGLPVGMQPIRRRFDEVAVLAASAAFERTRPWYGSQRNGKRRQHA